jgi:magnesium transporter
MTRIFYIHSGKLTWEKDPESLSRPDGDKVVWVDLQGPTEQEKADVEAAFEVEFQTPQEIAEIESSSRYIEYENSLAANNTLIVADRETTYARQVVFIMQDDILFTFRNADLRAFADTVRKLKTIRNTSRLIGSHILILLLETRIDLDADFIEFQTRQTTYLSRKMTKQKDYGEETLIRITELQENMILIRESIIDKQRFVSSLLKSSLIAESEKERLRIIVKDINSLMQHTAFGFERLEYLQDTFMGLVNIEQNQVIKIFTVVTVVFMPPTLIASIYGMNFEFMPELDVIFGYPAALLLMVISSLVFLIYFKKRGWL